MTSLLQSQVKITGMIQRLNKMIKVIIVKIGSKLVLQHRAMLIIIKYEEFRSIVDDIGFRLEYWLKLF